MTAAAALGGTQQITTLGPPGAQASLFVSLPSHRPLIDLSSLVVWLDPVTTLFAGTSQLTAAGTWTHKVFADPSLPRGLPLLWQSAVIATGGTSYASEPAVSIVH